MTAPIDDLLAAPEELTTRCRSELALARTEAGRLAQRSGAPPAQLLAAYDALFSRLSEVTARTSLARSVHPHPALRDAAERCEQEAESLATDLSLDPRLYKVLRGLDPAGLDGISRHLLEKALRDFRRAGVDRDEATRARVKELRDELVRIGQEFGRNIRDDVAPVGRSRRSWTACPTTSAAPTRRARTAR